MIEGLLLALGIVLGLGAAGIAKFLTAFAYMQFVRGEDGLTGFDRAARGAVRNV